MMCKYGKVTFWFNIMLMFNMHAYNVRMYHICMFSLQIFELCGAGTHLGRRQFYAALKLVAASQAGMALQPEMVHRGLEVPLPRFTWTTPQQQQSASQQTSMWKKDKTFHYRYYRIENAFVFRCCREAENTSAYQCKSRSHPT
jgi:hypothetical protein